MSTLEFDPPVDPSISATPAQLLFDKQVDWLQVRIFYIDPTERADHIIANKYEATVDMVKRLKRGRKLARRGVLKIVVPDERAEKEKQNEKMLVRMERKLMEGFSFSEWRDEIQQTEETDTEGQMEWSDDDDDDIVESEDDMYPEDEEGVSDKGGDVGEDSGIVIVDVIAGNEEVVVGVPAGKDD